MDDTLPDHTVINLVISLTYYGIIRKSKFRVELPPKNGFLNSIDREYRIQSLFHSGEDNYYIL